MRNEINQWLAQSQKNQFRVDIMDFVEKTIIQSQAKFQNEWPLCKVVLPQIVIDLIARRCSESEKMHISVFKIMGLEIVSGYEMAIVIFSPYPECDPENRIFKRTFTLEENSNVLYPNYERADNGFTKTNFNAKFFGFTIKLERTKMRYSTRQVAALLGVSAATISRIENGENPDIISFIRLYKFYNIQQPIDFFIENDQKNADQ